jgi:hypothetical protein
MRGIQFQYSTGKKIYWKKTMIVGIVLFFFLMSIVPIFNQGIKKAEITQSDESDNTGNFSDLPTNFSATSLNRFQIRLDWTEQESIDWTWIEYSLSFNATWQRGDHQNVTNTTTNQFIHQDLDPHTTYYYKAWSWNNTMKQWTNGTIANATTENNSIPTIELLNPSVESLDNLDPTVQWIVKVKDADEDIISWSIECSNNQSLHCNTPSETTRCLTLQHLNFSTEYTVWVNATDCCETKSKQYSFTVRDIYMPTKPNSFFAETISSTEIKLFWAKGYRSDETYIEFNNVSTWERGNGTAVFKGEETSFLCSSLNPHTIYYFQAWSWNKTDNAYQEECVVTESKTLNTIPEFGIPTPPHQSKNQALSLTWMINIHDNDLDSLDWSITCSNGQWTNKTNDRPGIKSIDLTNLEYNQEVTLQVKATDGIDTVKHTYSFFTKSENELPIINEIYPKDNSNVALKDLHNITVNISDLENDSFYWNITTHPFIGDASNTTTSGLIYCSVSNLEIDQEYTWNLSIQDQSMMKWKNQSYCFTIVNSSKKENEEIASDELTADAGGPYEGIAKTSLEFDASKSTSKQKNITGYRWDFDNDGTWDTTWINESTITHTYETADTYTIKLQITNGDSFASDTAEVVIVQYNNPPTLTTITDPSYDAFVNDVWQAKIKLNDLDGDQVRYKIKWSETEEESWSTYQNSGTEIGLSHLWNSTGTKQVKVQVEDSNHAVSKWYTIAVVSVYKYNISQAEEELAGLFTKTTGKSNEPLHFDAYEDGFIPLDVEVVSVSWSFGDESTASGIQVDHSYKKGGTYTITCVSITDDNQVLSIDHTITIESESSLASVVKSFPMMWIGLFAGILLFLLFFYFVIIKKQILPKKIPGFVIQNLSKLTSIIPMLKEKKSGLTVKTPEKPTDNFLGEKIVPAWQKSLKDKKPRIEDNWDEEVYKPMTFKGTYCEIMGKKIREERIQDQLNSLQSEIKSHDSERKNLADLQPNDNDAYDQSLEYNNN